VKVSICRSMRRARSWVSAEVMEWITEMETLQAAGLSADKIAGTLKSRFPVSGAGVERLLQLHRDVLVKVPGEGP
jgi:hypothetical protein